MDQTALAFPIGMSKIDLAQIRSRLLATQAELKSRGSERDLLDLKRVQTALRKLDHGGYGTCESCARAVPRERLLAAPHVRYCDVCSGGRSAPGSARRAVPARPAV